MTESDALPAEPKRLMTIGIFSRASQLTMKALRNYHASGLLVPAEIDPVTGYRAYDLGQLADASVISKLRSLDVSLEDVSLVMTARDPEVTAKILRQHLDTMEAKLDETRQIVDQLMIGQAQPGLFTPPRVQVVANTHVATVTDSIDRREYAAFLGQAFDQLIAAVNAGGVALAGPPGALYPPQADEEETVTAYVPIGQPFPVVGTAIEIAELPARTVATITHIGCYDDIGEAYNRLGRWVTLNADPVDGPVRESYLRSYAESDDPAEFVTEIHWPIAALT